MIVAVVTKPNPFFQFDGGKGDKGYGNDAQPRLASHGRGVEQFVHDGRVGEEKLDRLTRPLPRIAHRLEKTPNVKIDRVSERQLSK